MSVIVEELFLGIAPRAFKEWLKAYYFNKHRLTNALSFVTQEQGDYICYYSTPHLPVIRLKITVQKVVGRFVRVEVEQIDHPRSNPKTTQDYVTELLASAVEEEIISFEPFDGETLERQFLESGIIKLGEQGESNIIRFLLEYNDVQQRGATKEELVQFRCRYLAAEGRANLIRCLWKRHWDGELKSTEQGLLDLNERLLRLKEQIADYGTGTEKPVWLVRQVENLEKDFKLKERYRQELKELVKSWESKNH